MKVEFFTKQGCPLCDKGFAILEELATTYRFEIESFDIHDKDEWLEQYQLKIPVVCINDKEADYGLLNKIKLEETIKQHL